MRRKDTQEHKKETNKILKILKNAILKWNFTSVSIAYIGVAGEIIHQLEYRSSEKFYLWYKDKSRMKNKPNFIDYGISSGI